MARLETELQRTYRKINRMMVKGSDAKRVRRFYSLVHHYEHLHERFLKVHGYVYNPTSKDYGYREIRLHD
jgi:hypothetical protein